MVRFVRTFQGRNGQGPISVSGVRVGDLLVASCLANGNPTIMLGKAVVTDDEVQQVDFDDNSATGFFVLFEREMLLP